MAPEASSSTWQRIVTSVSTAPGIAVAAALAGLHLLLAALAFDPVPHPGGDNTGYLALARSLLENGSYVDLWDPARPPHAQYPPGFPAILALALSLGVESWQALKTLMVAFAAAAVALSYLWMRASTRPAFALGAGFLLAVSPGLVSEGLWVLSDVPFWALTMGALLALERERFRTGVALAFLALAVRSAGLPLVVGVVVWLGLRRRWRSAALVALGLVVVAGVWSLRTPGIEASYASQFWLANPYRPEAGTVGPLGLLERVWTNSGRYTLVMLPRVLTGAGGLIAGLTAAALLTFAGIGLGRRFLRRTPGPAEIFVPLYAAIVLLWPAGWAAERFLLPLLPPLLMYAAEGIDVLPTAAARRAIRRGGVVMILVLAIVPGIVLVRSAARCRAEVRASGPVACLGADQRAFIELAERSREALGSEAVVVSRKPRQWYWFSGAPGVVYPFSSDRDRLLDEAAAVGARYLVVDRLDRVADVYLVPVLVRHQQRFCLVRHHRAGPGAATLLGILPPEEAWTEAVDSAAGPTRLERPGQGSTRVQLRFPFCPPSYSSSSPPPS